MAGLGRKVFTSGEILTAADLQGYAVDQSVMVFDDSTARGSAIPSPSEGMVTYLKDEDAVTFYDGSAFKRVGGLIEVKSALKTDTFSASVAAGADVAVTDLSITHEVADSANKLIITAFFGMVASPVAASVGLAIHDGTGLIAVGDTAGNRTSVTSSSQSGAVNNTTHQSMSITFVHTPGSGSKTYTVRALNVVATTQTLYINRQESDTDLASRARSASALVIQEVAV